MSEITMASAAGVWQFDLARHDEESTATLDAPAETEAPDTSTTATEETATEAAPEAEAGDTGTEPESDQEPEESDDSAQLGDRGKRALERMKAERVAARQEAQEAKRQLARLQAKVQEFEDRDKSELEKATAKAERLADQATKATARAVQAEMRVLATDRFADPTDATDTLMRDPAKYVDESGDIDTERISADIEDLLERKPHWARPKPEPSAAPAQQQEEPPRQRPRPDPSQGARPTTPPTDFRNASKDEVAAEFAKFGYRPRS